MATMETKEPNLLRDGEGRPLFAILPYDEYQRLLRAAEELADEAAFDDAVDQERIPAEFADRLIEGENPVRVWRQYRGLSQTDLAGRVGITQPYLSEIELGKSPGSVRVLTAIARTLEIDLDDLAPAAT